MHQDTSSFYVIAALVAIGGAALLIGIIVAISARGRSSRHGPSGDGGGTFGEGTAYPPNEDSRDGGHHHGGSDSSSHPSGGHDAGGGFDGGGGHH